MEDNNQQSGFSRRRFIQASAGMTLLIACGRSARETGGGATDVTSTLVEPSKKLSGDLKILQWSHFVPRHDRWFDPFAADWGRQVGVNVSVDHINLADIQARASAEISAREGHDLIEFLSPPAAFEPSVLDLTDLNQEGEKRFGKQLALCTRSTFNPTTRKYYGFCHGWVPDPGDYRKSMWEKVGLPNGPTTYQELLDVGGRIKRETGVQLGVGMSNELDSNMAARAIIWSFGGSIQDERENLVFNSPQTIEAVDYMTRLFRASMTDEVFAWNAASNNQGLASGQLSYILNSISAWRTTQDTDPDVADDIYFTPALRGPVDARVASHVMYNWLVPNYAKNPDAAKEFLLHYVGNSDLVTYNSKLYDFPAYSKVVPGLNGWLRADPFGAKPADKLALLERATDWSTNVGHPGPANGAEGEVFATFVIPNMFAKAARGQATAAQAVAEAEAQIKPIFDKWRQRGLIGTGGS